MQTGCPKHVPCAAIVVALTSWLVLLASLGETAEPTTLSIAHDEYIYMIRFSPDGKTLATAAGDNVARVWDWSTRELRHTLKHDAAVYVAVFSPTEDLLATGSGDGKVSLWTASTGKRMAQRQEHADAVYCLSFAPDGQRLASIGGDGKKGDTQCRIWRATSWEVAKVLPEHARPAYGVLFGPRAGSARNTLVTSGGDKLIQLYACNSEGRQTFKGHTSDVYRCCFSPDGEQLASTSQDGSVRLWDIASGKQLKKLFKTKHPMYDVTYSRNGSTLAAVGDDGFVRFWNTKTYELLLEAKTDKEGLYSVVFTPDQTCVITGGVRGKVYLCSVPNLESNGRVSDSNTTQQAVDVTRP